MLPRPLLAVMVALVLISGCAGSTPGVDTAEAPQAFAATDLTESIEGRTGQGTQSEEETPVPTMEAEAPEAIDVRAFVGLLASDELNGRDNETPESVLAQDIIIDVLENVASPAFDGGGRNGYLQPFTGGANILGIQQGSGELADEYVVVGAHYDGLGPGQCARIESTDDRICNGAADNATGVALVLAVAHSAIARVDGDGTDRRGLIIAFWDTEEDGLVGSGHYVRNPVVPTEQLAAYINFDIQGASLSPSLTDVTFAIGAETGGEQLIDAVRTATDAASLEYAELSLIFGQGRSDHARFVSAGVPVVSFTDVTNGCYHTVKDDVDHVDFDKLAEQVTTAAALTIDLLTRTRRPANESGGSISQLSDAQNLLATIARGIGDVDLLEPAAAERSNAFMVELETIVAAGPDAYNESVGAVLTGTQALVTDLANGPCLAP